MKTLQDRARKLANQLREDATFDGQVKSELWREEIELLFDLANRIDDLERGKI